MCGIFGFFNREARSLSDGVLQEMGRILHHRGPDGFGLYTKPGVAIGNTRLAVIDPEHGQQPFLSAAEDIAVVQNGEIYNYRELAQELRALGISCKTQCDTEVILHLYQHYGIDFVSRLNGMFSIAIYDYRIQTLFLIRDRLGVKPLYFYEDGSQLVFASEIKALFAAGIPKQLNAQAVHDYLTYNYVPPPATIFEGIYHLDPGTILQISAERFERKSYWDLRNAHQQDISERDAIERLTEIFTAAVSQRMRCDVPFGAFLSGGVDSSSVVGLMSRFSSDPIDTFSIGFADPRFDESKYAKLAADRFHTRHHQAIATESMMSLWSEVNYYCDQPHGDVSFMPTYLLSKLAREQVTVVLTGDGGDELFAGYDKYRIPLLANDFVSPYLDSISVFTPEQKAQLYRHNSLFSACEPSDRILRLTLAEVPHFDKLNQLLYFDTRSLLPGNNLVKPDRMGMAVSLEARTPLLDHRLVEFAFSLAGEMKLNQGETKAIFKKAVAPLIGEELTYRKKQMFTVPIGEWFKTHNPEFLQSQLLSADSWVRTQFSAEYLQHLIESHLSGSENYTRQLRALVALELHIQRFFKG